jgi:hypothetical protein
VNSVTANYTTITVSSTPQTATLYIGDEKKFSLNDSNYYDLYVKLNSINGFGANLTIQGIHEYIGSVQTNQSNPGNGANNNNGQNTPAGGAKSGNLEVWTIVLVVVIIIIVVIAIYFLFLKNKKKRYYHKGY